MFHFRFFTDTDIAQLTTTRSGETKLGECVKTCNLDSLGDTEGRYVIVGMPEDIGVRANHGIGGADTSWIPFLKSFLNTQANRYIAYDQIIVLGNLEIDESVHAIKDESTLRKLVMQIDDILFPIISSIVSHNKIPIVIGGGHNNAFPIIKGTSLAKKMPLSVINIDAHTDFRVMEGRHSGNGFHYAMDQGFLDYYHVFGVFENYIQQEVLDIFDKDDRLETTYFEEFLSYPYDTMISKTIEELVGKSIGSFGYEIDLDCIKNTLSSAMSPTGFSLEQVRQLLSDFVLQFYPQYLHLCEGVYKRNDGLVDPLIGKTMSTLVTDFIKMTEINIQIKSQGLDID